MNIRTSFLSVILVWAPLILLVLPQVKTGKELPKFSITVDSSINEKISLGCSKGCAWLTLTSACTTNKCDTTIDQFGVHTDYTTEEGPDLANFIIKIERAENEYLFSCTSGCAWKELTVNAKDLSTKDFIISESGGNFVDQE